MELHLDAGLIMDELIKINFITVNIKGSHGDWLLVLESGRVNTHTSANSLTSDVRARKSFFDASLCHLGGDSAGTSRPGINFLTKPPIPGGGPQLMNC